MQSNECKQRLDKANSLIKYIYDELRKEYPANYQKQIENEFGEIGQPYEMINKIEEYLLGIGGLKNG